MKYLLDTNTLIYAYRGQGKCRDALAQSRSEELVLSSIVVFEVEYGIAKSTNPERLRTYLRQMQERCVQLDWCGASARAAAHLRANLERQGQMIGHYDLLIAGCALAHDLIVVTRNVREFGRVPDLHIENWYD